MLHAQQRGRHRLLAGGARLVVHDVLERFLLGIAGEMQSKIVIPAPGTPVGEVVANGEAELGIQQISELLPVAGIEIVGPLPAELQKITTFSAGVLTTAREPDTAKALVEFLSAEFPPRLKAKGLESA